MAEDIYWRYEMYVTDFPEAEALRDWLTPEVMSGVFVRGSSPYGSLPGGYLLVRTFDVSPGYVFLIVQDNNAWGMVRSFRTGYDAWGYLHVFKENLPLTQAFLKRRWFYRV